MIKSTLCSTPQSNMWLPSSSVGLASLQPFFVSVAFSLPTNVCWTELGMLFPLCKNIQSGSSLVDERLSKPSWKIYKNIFFFSNKSNKCLFLVMVERLDFEFFAYHFARVWELRHVLIIWNPRENLKATLWLVSFWEWHAQLCSADVWGEGEWDRHKKRLPGGYGWSLGSLSNHDDDGNKNPTNLHNWQWKTVVLHALHVHFSFFDSL